MFSPFVGKLSNLFSLLLRPNYLTYVLALRPLQPQFGHYPWFKSDAGRGRGQILPPPRQIYGTLQVRNRVRVVALALELELV